MKYCTVIILSIWMFAGFAQAQKGKIKGNDKPVETPVTNPDSMKAAAVGKAAIRGGQNMTDARDSLRGANLEIPASVVDTFGTNDPTQYVRSFISRADLETAQARIDDMKQQLADAQTALDGAVQSKKYSEKQVKAAQQRLDVAKEHLKATEADFQALLADWESSTGQHLSEPAEESSEN